MTLLAGFFRHLVTLSISKLNFNFTSEKLSCMVSLFIAAIFHLFLLWGFFCKPILYLSSILYSIYIILSIIFFQILFNFFFFAFLISIFYVPYCISAVLTLLVFLPISSSFLYDGFGFPSTYFLLLIIIIFCMSNLWPSFLEAITS